jgi:DNA processing protein
VEDPEVVATIALSLAPGVGLQRLRMLVANFGSAQAALASPQAKLNAPLAAGERVLVQLRELGARVVLQGDPDFPPQLEEIREPPPLLYVWGDLSLCTRPTVAIIGSRDHTSYGADAARILASAVATRAVVVSGMARGIDAIAHHAALEAGGRSIGVLGNGFGVVYPKSNAALYERMVQYGCLITEHPPWEPPHTGSFPQRNRLISGLARAVVVVEAGEKSGALNTANEATEQHRPVLAVPGPITSRTSYGTNCLIRDGAKPALTAGDILEEIGIHTKLAELGIALSTPAPRTPPVDLTGLQLTIWNQMTREPQHVDSLVGATRTQPAEVLGALTELELRGLVRQGPGMVFGLC